MKNKIFSLQSDEETANTGGEPTPTKCVWCDQSLTAKDIPKLLECLHVACGSCVTAKFSEIDRTQPALIHCPVCNMASQADLIIVNQFLIEQTANSFDDSQSNTDSDKVISKQLTLKGDSREWKLLIETILIIFETVRYQMQQLQR